jgi:hypothetical protein
MIWKGSLMCQLIGWQDEGVVKRFCFESRSGCLGSKASQDEADRA